MIEPITLFSTIAGCTSVASKLSIDLSKLIVNLRSVPAQLTQVSNELISLSATLASLEARFNPLATTYTEEQLQTLNTVVENTRETLTCLTKIVEGSRGRKWWGRVGWMVNAEEVGGYRNGLVAYTTMLGLLTATLADQRAASTEAMVARVLLILEGNDLSTKRTRTNSNPNTAAGQPSPPPTYSERPAHPRRSSTDKAAKAKKAKTAKKASSEVASAITVADKGTTAHRLDYAGRWIVREIRINGSWLGSGTVIFKNDPARRRVSVIVRLDSSRESRLVYRWLDTTTFKRTKQGSWVTGPSYALQKLERGDDDYGEVNVRLEDVNPLAGQRSMLIAVNLIKQLPSEWLQVQDTFTVADFSIDEKLPLTPPPPPAFITPSPSPSPRVRQTRSQIMPAQDANARAKMRQGRSQNFVNVLPEMLQVGSPPPPTQRVQQFNNNVTTVRFEEDLRGARERERYRVPGGFIVDMSGEALPPPPQGPPRTMTVTPRPPPKPLEYRAVSDGPLPLKSVRTLRGVKSSANLNARMSGSVEEQIIGMPTLEVKRKGGWFRFGS